MHEFQDMISWCVWATFLWGILREWYEDSILWHSLERWELTISSGSLTLWISWISMDIMDIHGHFWICMDMDMVNIQMDIHVGYPCWISMLDIHVYYGYSTWVSILDMYGYGYGGYPKGYSKYRSKEDIHVYYGYPTLISCLDIHNIHVIQRTES